MPVASISREPQILAVHPSIPANTVSEFIAYAKANPGKISMASGGNGTPAHLAGELFKMMPGVDRFTCRIVVQHRRSPILSAGTYR